LTATKILWGQILVVFAIVLATLWGATEWTAWRLGFQPQLGPPWFEVANVPVYLPVVPENPIRPDSHGEAESAHHRVQWLRCSA
jgi:hypothetical protein